MKWPVLGLRTDVDVNDGRCEKPVGVSLDHLVAYLGCRILVELLLFLLLRLLVALVVHGGQIRRDGCDET